MFPNEEHYRHLEAIYCSSVFLRYRQMVTGKRRMVGPQNIGVARGGQKGHDPPNFWKYTDFVLWEAFFQTKQCIRLKSNILAPTNFWPPPSFWAGYDTAAKSCFVVLYVAFAISNERIELYLQTCKVFIVIYHVFGRMSTHQANNLKVYSHSINLVPFLKLPWVGIHTAILRYKEKGCYRLCITTVFLD